jgi:hypothetical protein
MSENYSKNSKGINVNLTFGMSEVDFFDFCQKHQLASIATMLALVKGDSI